MDRGGPFRGQSRKRLGWDAGVAAVEMAIVLPILVLLVFGIIQFGIAYNRQQGLNAAVREGARLGSVGGNFTDIQTRVQSAQSLFTASDVVVTTSPASSGTASPCASAGIGGTVTVIATVSSPAYALDIPLFGTFNITYNASGVFRCERVGP